MKELKQLVYVSSACGNFKESDLVDILDKSRKYNSDNNITGFLLYDEGNFMQCLEGEQAKLDPIIKKIEKDPRHKGVIMVYNRVISEREFEEWTMGFRRVPKGIIMQHIPYLNDFLKHGHDLDNDSMLGEASKKVRTMLETFRLMGSAA